MIEESSKNPTVILNVHSPNNRASKYMKQWQTKLKKETDKLKLVSWRQEISKYIDEVNIINQLDCTNIYKPLHFNNCRIYSLLSVWETLLNGLFAGP